MWLLLRYQDYRQLHGLPGFWGLRLGNSSRSEGKGFNHWAISAAPALIIWQVTVQRLSTEMTVLKGLSRVYAIGGRMLLCWSPNSASPPLPLATCLAGDSKEWRLTDSLTLHTEDWFLSTDSVYTNNIFLYSYSFLEKSANVWIWVQFPILR